MTTNINNFPEDLVVEILSRVPAVSLTRLRSACKRWNVLIGDGVLAKKQYANAPKHTVVILLINFRVCLVNVDLCGIHDNVAPSVKATSPFSLKDPLFNCSEQVDIRDVFHCDGLLLCISVDKRMVVWNPCSGETRWVQPRDPKFRCYALGKSSCNKYKILSRKSLHEYEIYDFTSESWRSFEVSTKWLPCGRGMCVNGNAYWLDDTNEFLVCFDFSTERFLSVPPPDDPKINIYEADVALSVTREGKQLCMLAAHVEEFAVTNIWMATNSEVTKEMSWSKLLTVARNDLPYRCHFKDRISFLANEENKVVLACNCPSRFSKNIIHIVGEDKYIQVDHLGVEHVELSWTPVLLSYVPSLVQIQQSI